MRPAVSEEDFDYEVLEKYDGVYYIIPRGAAVEKGLAVQIMVQKSELLLQALDKRPLDEATAGKVAEVIADLDEDSMKKLDFWFKALAPKNAKIISKRMGMTMTKTDKAYLEVMEELGYAESLRQEGMQKGIQKGAMEVIAMLEKGYSLADAKKKLKLA